MQDACAELTLHLAEVRFGVRSAGEAVRAGAAARADLVTLEGAALTVELDEGGVRALNAAASTPRRYATLSSLLLNESAGFVAAFNGAGGAALNARRRARGGGRAQRAPTTPLATLAWLASTSSFSATATQARRRSTSIVRSPSAAESKR